MSRLALSFLGSPHVAIDGRAVELKRRKPLALLAYLTVTAETHSREALTEMLYPGAPREQGYSNFRQTLAALRQVIGDKRLVADQGGVGLKDSKDLWVDVAEFRRLIEETKRKAGGSSGAEKSLSQAAALVRGAFLAGFSLKDSPEFEDWQSERAESLRRDQAWVPERVVALHESREEYREAIEPCRKWLALDSFEEAIHCRLMRLYALSGLRSQALKQYQRCSILLEKELGEKPGKETEELRDQIARGRFGPQKVKRAAPAPAEPPVQSDPFSIPFVGREMELGRLKIALEQARAGKGRMVMLVGEAGIGKTRLLEEAAAFARDSGAWVIWGRCYPDAGLPPLWPWRQALGQLVRESRPDSVRKWAGTRASVLGQIVEDIGEALGILAAPVPLEDPESERFRTSEAVWHLLVEAAREQTLILVLDDLHCADSATLGLLEFVAHGLDNARLVLLAGCRNVESDPAHALRRTLGELARERCFERIDLSPLGQAQVAEMVRQSADQALPARFAEALWERTRGNALFVVESLRFKRMETERPAAQTGTPPAELMIPPSIRALIRRQLEGASPDCRSLLETAAAFSSEFTMEVLGAAQKISERALSGVLEEALAAHFLFEESGAYRFSHPLVQETIYEDLPHARRTELHAGIARALEAHYGETRDSHAIELARHLAAAASLAPAEKLAHYSLAAGEQALRERANPEALLHFQRGLALKGPGTNDAETAWLRFGVASAMPKAHVTTLFDLEFDGGDTTAYAQATAAYDYFVKVGDLGSAVKVAEFPLALDSRHSGDWQLLSLKAIEIVRADSIDEARLLRLNAVNEFDRTGDFSVFSKHIARALTLAQRHGDKLLEFRILSTWVDTAAGHSREATAEMIRRAQELIGQVDDPMAAFPVHFEAYHVALSRGDMTAATRCADAMMSTAGRLRSDFSMKVSLSVRLELCWVRGDWSGMRTASDQALAVESDSPDFRHQLGLRACLELESGNTAAGNRFLQRYVSALEHKGLGNDLETSQATKMLARLGRLTGDQVLFDMARTAAACTIPPGEEHLPQKGLFQANLSRFGLALTAAYTGDGGLAGRLREWYSSHYDNWMVGLEPSRPRLLGLLDMTRGEARTAVQELDQALQEYRAYGPSPDVAWTCSELAEALLSRDGQGDSDRARQLLREADAMATSLSMVPLQERCRRLAAQIRVPAQQKRKSGGHG